MINYELGKIIWTFEGPPYFVGRKLHAFVRATIKVRHPNSLYYSDDYAGWVSIHHPYNSRFRSQHEPDSFSLSSSAGTEIWDYFEKCKVCLAMLEKIRRNNS